MDDKLLLETIGLLALDKAPKQKRLIQYLFDDSNAHSIAGPAFWGFTKMGRHVESNRTGLKRLRVKLLKKMFKNDELWIKLFIEEKEKGFALLTDNTREICINWIAYFERELEREEKKQSKVKGKFSHKKYKLIEKNIAAARDKFKELYGQYPCSEDIDQCGKPTIQEEREDSIPNSDELQKIRKQKRSLVALFEAIEQDADSEFQRRSLFPSIKAGIAIEKIYIPVYVTSKRRFQKDQCFENSKSEDEFERFHDVEMRDDGSQSSSIPWDDIKAQEKRIMVLGDPGMGKSTLLLREAKLLASEQRKKLSNDEVSPDNVVLPILMVLSYLEKEGSEIDVSIYEFIKKQYPRIYAEGEDELKDKLEKGKCLLLLDSLDDVSLDNRKDLSERLDRFSRNNSCRIICTSRKIHYTGPFFADAVKVALSPLNPKQTRAYMTNWFSISDPDINVNDKQLLVDGLLMQLGGSKLKWMYQTPLILSFICKLHKQGDLFTPLMRSQIYKRIVNYLLDEWGSERGQQTEGRVIAKEMLLEKIAFVFFTKGEFMFLSGELYREINKACQDEDLKQEFIDMSPSELMHELTEIDGMLLKVKDVQGNVDQYTFFHNTLQEYLTASYLDRSIRDPDKGIDAVKKEYLWDHDWHEVLCLLSGLMKDPMQLIELIQNEDDDIFGTQLVLSGQCIAETPQNYDIWAAKTIRKIAALWNQYPSLEFLYNAVNALCETNVEMKSVLLDIHREVSEQKYWAHLKMLIEDGKPFSLLIWLCLEIEDRGTSALKLRKITNLDDSKFGEVKKLITNLGFFAQDGMLDAVVADDRPGLSKMLRDDAFLWHSQKWTYWFGGSSLFLARGKGQPHNDLMQSLKKDEKHPEGKATAILLLEELGNDRAVDGLMQSLKDEKNLELKTTVVQALGLIGDVRVVKELVELLKDEEDLGFRMTVMQALGRIKDNRVVDDLIQLLKNEEDISIRSIAVWALGEIGDDRPVDDLIQLFKDEKDLTLKMVVAWSLGRIGGIRGLDDLLQLLKDEKDPEIVDLTVCVVGEIGDDRAVDDLIQLLKNEKDPNIRTTAIWALGRIKDNRAVDDLIQLLKNEEDPNVKRTAIWALREIGDDQAIDDLMQLVKDGEDFKNGGDEKVVAIESLLGLDGVVKPSPLYDLRHLSSIDSRILRNNPEIPVSPIEKLGKMQDLSAIDNLVNQLSSENATVKRMANNSLAEIGTLEILEKIIKHPRIYIFEPDNLILAKVLAFHHRKRKTNLIPVYPEIIKKYKSRGKKTK